jgi:lysosomal Pro-X carboxypeptidase
MKLIRYKQNELGCGPRGSITYCPVMTVGGSYAGLLSTLARKEYPQVVDIGYAGSPCLLLFGHQVNPYQYYEYTTQVAEQVSHGCPDAVRQFVAYTQSELNSLPAGSEELSIQAEKYGICGTDFPSDLSGDDLARQLISFTSGNFANTLMDYYPPGPETQFFQGCEIFQDTTLTIPEQMKHYIRMIRQKDECLSLADDEDDNPEEDEMWDALCCYMNPQIGKSNATMWPPSPYSFQDNVESCQEDFGIDVNTDYLDQEFGLRDLSGVTRLILTNGKNDPWYTTSYTEPFPNNPGIVVITMENGGHHSDLTHQLQVDTPDVEMAHSQISEQIAIWLDELKPKKSPLHHKGVFSN